MLIIFVAVLVFPAVSAAMITQVGFEGEIMAGNPLYIAIDDDGTIYASQKNKTITVMGPDGQVKNIIGGKDKKWKGILKEPKGISLYGDKIYVADSGLGRVAVFTKDGEYVESFGRKGSKFRQFSSPQDVCVYKGIIYVADTGNSRIQAMGLNGVYIKSFGKSDDELARLKKPVGIEVDHRGLIYVVDVQDEFVKIYKPDGSFYKRIKGIREPKSITLGPDGIYVSDMEMYSVRRFNYKYNEEMSFGTKGSGRAQFESIVGLGLDREGKVYVADTRRGMIHVFSPKREDGMAPLVYAPPPTSVRWEGEIKGALHSIAWDRMRRTMYGIDLKAKSILVIKDGEVKKTITIEKAQPTALAVAMDGGLWVIDGKNKYVYKLRAGSFDEEFHFGGSGGREGYFKSPSDISISSTGEVYVADKSARRIQVFSPDGVFVGVLGKGGTDDLLMSPLDMDFDSKNMLYVLDEKKRSVLIFGTNGMVVKEFGGKSVAGEVFKKPVAIAVSKSEIFVLDNAGPTVRVFDKQGEYLREFGSPGDRKVPGKGEFVRPASIAFKDDIRVLVSDPQAGRVQELLNVYTPEIPRGVGARGGTRSAMIHWERGAQAFVSSYAIYRSEADNGIFEKVGESETNSYVDKGLKPDRQYFYRVTALAKGGNESRRSRVVKAVPAKYKASPPNGLVARAQEWSVELSWEPAKGGHVAYYVIYRQEDGALEEVGKAEDTGFVVGSLMPDTDYMFFVSAVSEDEVESEKVSTGVKTQIATRPPIEMDVVEIEDIFSNTYKKYERDGVGKIRIANNTMDNISKLKVEFTIKDFMDFPWETEVRDLPPREEAVVDLKAVFNNRILEVTEDTPVQTELKVSYYLNQELKSYRSSHTINVFEKHKMKWDERERMSAFVTTKDVVVLEFTREIVTQYRDTSDPLLYASIFFDGLGVLGMTYIVDPSTPYQETSNNVDKVDYLQYPRETLKRKSGDCDDLVILTAAALESLGIRTKVLDIPGHMFMMFEVGKVDALGTDTHDNFFVIHDDSVWVPLEATLVGKTFMEAWEEGSRKYYKWEPQGLLGIMDLRKSWEMFKPANLPLSDWRPNPVSRDDIEKNFNQEFQKLRKIIVKLRSKRFIAALEKDPKDVYAFLQLGIVFAESGELEDAMKSFQKALEIEPDNAALINNMGNIHFLEGRHEDALKAYDDATKADPADPYIWVNLTRAYLRLEKKKEAKEAFAKAYQLDPVVAKKFRGMSLELLGPI
jgi:DNA-binding beta-propeller fold protein YncE/predicted negative regulator of RcsB-dependent stress response